MIDRALLLTYLYYGYLPRFERKFVFEQLLERKTDGFQKINESPDLEKYIEKGTALLQSIFADMTPQANVVPLSGGLDSRLVLGGLLSGYSPDRIHTVTYGSPGSFDFEIGNLVAKTLGTSHYAMDLNDVEFDQRELLELAIEEKDTWTYLFDTFYNRLICKKYGKEAAYWIGFMGDTLSGKRFATEENIDWRQARESFLKMNRFVRSTLLIPSDYDPMDSLPAEPFLDKKVLDYSTQLQIGVRQFSLVLHTISFEGYDYRTPFLTPEWVSFMLNTPFSFRKNQFLYKKILGRILPELLSLPCRNLFGLPLDAPKWKLHTKRIYFGAGVRFRKYFPFFPWKTHPYIGYIDFNRGLRKRDDLRNLVFDNLQDLKKRDILSWIDIDELWKRHQRSQSNYADALTLLTALEIHLKAKEAGYAESKGQQ